MLAAVARGLMLSLESQREFAFVLFFYITNHLTTGPEGNSEFCFPRISTLRFSGNKIHCSPRDQSLTVNYIASIYKALYRFKVVKLKLNIMI